jgi:transcriptional regulator with XRE-family HTH domain
MTPGELLRSTRAAHGLTQAELARRARTSQPVISAYERDRRDPTVGTLRRLIAAGGRRLRLEARPAQELPPPVDLDEHAQRLFDVLSLADAIPVRERPVVLDAPRLVSTRR